MKNFIFKSTGADLQKMFQHIETKLDAIAGNILYSTNQLDFVRKKLVEMDTNKALQKQVDEYFGDFSEDDNKTSPQTESDEQ